MCTQLLTLSFSSFDRRYSRLSPYTELEHFQDHLGGADGMPSVFRGDNGSKFWSSAPMKDGTTDDLKDTKTVSEMLRKQSDLIHMVDDYVEDHHRPDTFDMSDV
jgi:hypothetical protein